MKRIKPYLYTSLITLLILSVLFFVKGIYPFGNNSLIWGDMHDQITAFYYHFYDSFYGAKSLLVDFSTSAGVNFIGIFAYYILSPFSFLVLLVPREEIYLMVSIIVALKILLCSLTCLFFIRTYFKKLPSILAVMLALLYAFSNYGLSMYQITPWIDAMYLLPILAIGLKKLLDLEKPLLYVVILTISLILSFYVSIMSLIFIFLISFIYLLTYKEREDRKKAITSLGLFTALSLLIAACVIIPAYLQISVSYRIAFDIESLLNSKTGPITDKIGLLMFGGLIYVSLYILLKNYKNHKHFLTFYLPVMFMLLVPIIIEPVHKILLFGSYASFPYRFGYIMVFLLVLGCCYTFNNIQDFRGRTFKHNKALSILITLFSSVVMILLTYKYYYRIQNAIYKLSLSKDRVTLLVIVAMALISIVACLLIIKLNKKLNKLCLISLSIITITSITCLTFIYVGMDKYQNILTSEYEMMNHLSKNHNSNDYYRIKNDLKQSEIISNSGMVTKYHNIDHFTSLTDKNSLESFKKMGYSSMWVKIFSLGGNSFLDTILANKYLLTKDSRVDNTYKVVDKYEDVYLYSLKKNISYGYLMNYNDTIFDKNNSFEISNSIYNNITNKKDNIFEIVSDFDLDNVLYSKDSQYTIYTPNDKTAYSYLSKNIKVNGTKKIYLEALASLSTSQDYKIFKAFNIYINDKLFLDHAFTQQKNGVLDLGTFKDCEVNIKIELLRKVKLMDITLGVMDLDKLDDFIDDYYINTNISFDKNKVVSTVEVKDDDKILFLPLSYSPNYKAKNNGIDVDVIKLYDNFIGIKLNKGVNNIELVYFPNNLKLFIGISIVSLILTIIVFVTKLYKKIIDNKLIQNIMYFSYVSIYLLFIFCVYVLLTVCFMLSYFIHL